LNGFNQVEFFDLYFNELNSIRNFLKIKEYTNDELNDEWRKVTFAMKNHTDLHYTLLDGDIKTTKYLFNYDKITDDDNYKKLDIKEKQKFYNNKINKIKGSIISKLNEIEIINYITEHKGNTLTEYSQLIGKSEQTIRKVIKKNGLVVKKNNDQIKININLVYDWFIMNNLKPSMSAIIEGSKRTKNNNDIFYSKKTIKKHIDREIYSEKEYKDTLIENKFIDDEIKEKENYKFIDDDDEFDFWLGGDEFLDELKREEMEEDLDMNLFEPATEYNKTIQKINYKQQREKYKKELKIIEDKITEVIERDKKGYDDIDWNELDNNWLKKMGYTIKQIYDRISDEMNKKLEKELEKETKNDEYFRELKEADDRRSRLDRDIDDIFEID